MKRLLLLVVVFSIAGFVPLFTHAQITGLGSSDDSLTITTDPAYPKPNDQVTIALDSFAVDLNSATITWSLDGKAVLDGVGKKQFTFVIGALGTATHIHISISPLTGTSIEKDVAVTPSVVDFVWQAKTYTPPFYKGKALFTGQAPVVVAAVAQLGDSSGVIAPENLLYSWKQNEDNAPDQSGSGKLAFTMVGSLWGRDDSVTLDVSSADGSLTAEKTITFSPLQPSLIVYENNPLLGILYNHAISGTFAMNQNDEVSFFAAPFYFLSGLLSDGNTNYVWQMNGANVSDQTDGNTVTFRADSASPGTSAVSVSATQPRSAFQNSSANFSINFK